MAQRVGEILAEGRTLKGVSIADASEHTRIRSAFLTALEQSDYDALPAIGHTKGFVISYAQYLGLDSNALAAQIADEIRAREPEKTRGAFDRASQTDRTSTDTHEIPYRLVWMLVAAVIVIGALAWAITAFRAADGEGPKAPLRSITTTTGGSGTVADDLEELGLSGSTGESDDDAQSAGDVADPADTRADGAATDDEGEQ
jgi:cytoskeletal protein RodZ